MRYDNEFQEGDVWMSPRGILYVVTDLAGNNAVLRNKHSGRIVRRYSNDNRNWTKLQALQKDKP